jgi:hypothetical protein
MSDQDLREAERRFHDTGRPEDEAALILARRRSGIVANDVIESVVGLHYPSALLAVGAPIPAARLPKDDFLDRLRDALRRLTKAEVVGLICDCVEPTLSAWSVVMERDDRLKTALELARAWGRGQAAVSAVIGAGEAVSRGAEELRGSWEVPAERLRAASAADAVSHAVLIVDAGNWPRVSDDDDPVTAVSEYAADALDFASEVIGESVFDVARDAVCQRLLRTVRGQPGEESSA